MMFVFMSIPLCGLIGLAVDMGRIYHVAMHTQGALDSAALAAGRVPVLGRLTPLERWRVGSGPSVAGTAA